MAYDAIAPIFFFCMFRGAFYSTDTGELICSLTDLRLLRSVILRRVSATAAKLIADSYN